MGHVIGKNTETVTLPYGFKTITTNGRNSNNNTTTLAAQDNIVADNTQDTLGINSGNEWIKIETNYYDGSYVITNGNFNIISIDYNKLAQNIRDHIAVIADMPETVYFSHDNNLLDGSGLKT